MCQITDMCILRLCAASVYSTSAFWHHWQVVILERRSQAGKVLYRSVSGGWNGSEEDKYRLYEQLELLQKDPTYLSSDATLPELNNEMAPVRHSRHTLTLVLRAGAFFGLMSLFSVSFLTLQMFIIQWMNAAYDYILQIYDDLLYSNW